MAWIFGIAVVVFVFVCLFLILLVLIQSDKGGGISGAIGGGLSNANTVLGAQDTANILTRGTTGFAIAYMVLCIVLSLVLSRQTGSVEISVLKKRAESQTFNPSSILSGGRALPGGEAGGEGAAPALPTE